MIDPEAIVVIDSLALWDDLRSYFKEKHGLRSTEDVNISFINIQGGVLNTAFISTDGSLIDTLRINLGSITDGDWEVME